MGALERLSYVFMETHPADCARTVERLPLHSLVPLFGAAPRRAGARTLEHLAPATAAACLDAMPAQGAASLIAELSAAHRLSIVRQMKGESRERCFGHLSSDVVEPLRRMLSHPERTIGDLMDSSALALPEDVSVNDAIKRARRAPRGVHCHLFVVDREYRLVGRVALTQLLRGRRSESLRSVMHRQVVALSPDATPEAAAASAAWREASIVPVADSDGLFLGVVHYETILRARAELLTAREGAGGLDAVLAFGELYWQGLSGILEGMAGGGQRAVRRGDEGGENGHRR
ncbi:MAG: magnesium transporter [Gammaproteobacteria bacterium]|nr:magnesium transporter [Gammaproteobacteria bacterium]NIR85522.1 magnesium transporter [Gammaproteobacteria bacterium]NIR89781.1 magnesium transporter [Gammaproteobacteria bacterium]NIU06657.1 magnesium transporter [Gammaproteobacteria bacterium]NIV75048.1 CBS domain-containing protein [Gammaproteobacteria bacterium]